MALPGFNIKSSVPTIQSKLIEEIIDYLNSKAGTKYKYDAKKDRKSVV